MSPLQKKRLEREELLASMRRVATGGPEALAAEAEALRAKRLSADIEKGAQSAAKAFPNGVPWNAEDRKEA